MKTDSTRDMPAAHGGAADETEHPEICIDMHCHSSLSDGVLPPDAVAKMLSESGAAFAALTDHNTVAGLEAFSRALAEYDIGYISGLEISTRYHGDILHILAYGFDPNCAQLRELLDSKNSFPPDEELTEKAYQTAAEIIGLIHRAGGIAVLAHPLATQPDLAKLSQLIDELQTAELDGIEAVYGPNTPEQNNQLVEMARARKLLRTAGTDFHDPADGLPGIRVGRELWNEFRDALLHTPFHQEAAPEPPVSKRRIRSQWFGFALRVILPAFLSLALLITALFAFLLPYYGKTLMDIKRETIRELTQAAYGVLSEAVQEEQSGNLALNEAQTLAKNRIAAMRYGIDNKDYFWLQDTEPRILMHPYRTDLNNQDVSEYRDAEGNRIFVEFSDLALQKGEGFVSYVWQWMDDPDRLEAKESYIRYFEPWGWIIGTGIYTNDVQAEIDTLRGYIVLISSVVIGAVLLLLAFLIRQGAMLETSRREATNLLIESTRRYKALSDAATEGVLFAAGGRCRYANTVLYEMLGCALGRIDLLHLRDLFPNVRENEAWLRILSNGTAGDEARTVGGVISRCGGHLLRCHLSVKKEPSDSSDGLMILIKPAGEAQEHGGTQEALDRLLHIPGAAAPDLANAVAHAGKVNQVVALCQKTPALALSMLENGTSSIAAARTISEISDAAARKFIEIAVGKLGAAPAPFAFLALGSQGRQAQTLFSDQDNALIYRPTGGEDDKAVQAYFLKLASAVCDHLETAGYAKCEGGMIASNPQWCKPLPDWKSDFAKWIREAQPKQIVAFCTLLDFRTLYGDPDLEEEIRDAVYSQIADDRLFLKQIAQNAVSFKTPQRLFGSMQSAGGMGIDVKTPAFAIVSFARFYAIRHGIRETNTLLQLDGIKRLGVITDARQRDIVAAYELLLRLRLWGQILAKENSEKTDAHIGQDQLGKVEAATLRESLKEIDAIQGLIEREFLGIV